MEILLRKKISIKLQEFLPHNRYEATIIIYRRRTGLFTRIFEGREYTYSYKIIDNRLESDYLNSREMGFNNFCYSKYEELSLYCEATIEEYKKGIRVVEPLNFVDENHLQ